MRNRYLLVCLVASGFAGLAYELLWVRLLSFSFGSTTLSYSTVLAVFFGGLALGAFLGGRRAQSLARPAVVYGWIELATGAAGLVLYPVLANLGSFFALIDPGSGLGGAVARALVSAPLLLVPTVLMGATLPVVFAAMVAEDQEVGRGSALIYGINTLGACLGAYATTYLLLPQLGLFAATLFTALVNFAAGAFALGMDRRARTRSRARPVTVSAPSGGQGATPRIVVVASVIAFLVGFAAIALQIVWVRLFSIFLHGTIYAVGSVLISVLVGIGLGSVLVATGLGRRRRDGLWLSVLQLTAAGSVVLLSGALPYLSHVLRAVETGSAAGLGVLNTQLSIVLAALALPTLCSGASFPLLVDATERSAARGAAALGRLYAANTVGSIAGSLLTGFWLLPGLGADLTIHLALGLTAIAAALAALALGDVPLRLGIALATVGVIAVVSYGGLDVARLSIVPDGQASYERAESRRSEQLGRLLSFSEGRVANVATFEFQGTRQLRVNNIPQGTITQGPPHYPLDSLLVALLPFLHAEDPKSALVVGLGAGVSVAAYLDLGMERIEVVELEPDVPPAVERIFGGHSPVGDPRVDLAIDDARHRLLLEAARGERFDIITSMPSHPWVAPNIFTQEFFELAAQSLAPGGVFSTWLGSSRADSRISASILRAFANVFESYLVYFVPKVGSYFMIGSHEPLGFDAEKVERLIAHPVTRDREDLGGAVQIASWIQASARSGGRAVSAGPVNTDDSAFAELFAPRSRRRSRVARGVLPHEVLLPELVSEDARPAFFLALIERLLGTPDGAIPTRKPIASLERARLSFEAARAFFDAGERAYLTGRLLDADGRGDAAREFYALARASESPVAERAARFAALVDPRGSRARARALERLSPSSDVLAAQLAIEPERALARVPPTPVDPERSPLAWLLWWGAHGREQTVDPGAMTKQLGALLRETDNVELLRLGIEANEALGLGDNAMLCRVWHLAAADREGRRLWRAGRSALDGGELEQAAEQLARALALRPAHAPTARALMLALRRLGRDDEVERLERHLLFEGADSRYLDFLERATR